MIQLNIIIVEDEPPIARFIKNMLEKMEDFKVIAVCEDAYDGIAEIKRSKVDILVTDIQMPGKNGLTLIKEIKQVKPEIVPVIISGFKIFEYAQEALKLSVYEYLVKPLDEEEVKKVFYNIKTKLLLKYSENSEKFFQNMLEENIWNQEFQDRYFRFPYVEIILLHWNNPIQEIMKQDRIIKSISDSIDYDRVCVFTYKDTLCIMIGSDHHKDIVFYANECINIVSERFQKDDLVLCAVVTRKDYPLYDCIKVIRKMYNKMKRSIRYEKKDIFYLEEMEALESDTYQIQNREKELYQHLTLCMWNELKTDYNTMFSLFEQQKSSRSYIKNKLCAFFWKLCAVLGKEKIISNILNKIEEVIQSARNYEEVMLDTWELIKELIQESLEYKKEHKNNVKVLFDNISQYINENISKSLYLNEICDVFCVSQPYVSRIFRQYAGCSYKKYVLNTKIERAVVMMQQNPDILIKDIASFLGFENALYFSTVFKNVKGISPSQFIKNLSSSRNFAINE